MSIIPGQGLLFKGFFANGTECGYERPFIVIDCTPSVVRVLNVSSIKDKATKLFYPSNKEIKNYNPPFRFPSFVKLDELYEIDHFTELNKLLLSGGRTMMECSFKYIINEFQRYSNSKHVQNVRFTRNDLELRNPKLLIKV